MHRLFIGLPDNSRPEFLEETFRLNIARGRVIAMVMIALETMLLAWKIASFKERDLLYIYSYIFIIVCSTGALAGIALVQNGRINSHNFIRLLTYVYISLIFIWGTAISLLDQKVNGSISVFVGCVFAVGLSAYLEPLIALFLYVLAAVLFFIGLYSIELASEIRTGHSINAAFSVIIAWAVSRQNFSYRLKEFKQSMLIKKKNAELLRRNKLLNRAKERLEIISTIDELTQVANRRAFERTYEKEWRRGMRDRKPLSLIFADVDLFKAFNDIYGHLAGDRCLADVALALSRCLNRPGDFIGRFGGEEFVIILSGTDQAGALYVCQKLHDAVRTLHLIHGQSRADGLLSISLGTATVIPELSIRSDRFMDLADQAMYLAKQAGRNCTRAALEVDVQALAEVNTELPKSGS